MTPPDRQADYVRLMQNAAIQIIDYTAGMDREGFLADAKTQDAVIMKLLVIGELAAKLIDGHSALIAAHPEIPWHQMKGMRNRMAHGYFELDLDVVWETVRQAIPDLAKHLRALAH
ncbi:DUF86 domain-containing protein [Azospira restricta]|uniref:DUF86 domain-containing protein n=1 Tax=Azospira restricta TaxID=404405 RepID=A0A974PY92_9RHOO|nr:DUF86 domain-containing protein [Azospira restricta]QRJ63333.1 DUF86 domain-containing protein [Azospira restricta]